MATNSQLIGITTSVCPVCYKRVNAEKVKRGNKVYLNKECGQHGSFSTLIWNGPPDYLEWDKRGTAKTEAAKNAKPGEKGCPYDCGICENHEVGTCCVLLEVTKNCNLSCPVCYASAGEGGHVSIEQIEKWYDYLVEQGKFNIQLSGGEPTVRDDLAEIIELGRKKGFDFFQLNTNGIRLAEESDYAKALKNAGLSCVFLQFDSLSNDAYLALRGKSLAETKLKAVENAGNAGLGVVLAPTIVKGINHLDIGPIIEYAANNMPVVRGVHFQPISFFGRYDSNFMAEERITLPDVLRYIETQTNGRIKATDFSCGNTESAYCSFHGKFTVDNGVFKASGKAKKSCCCSSPAQAAEYVAGRWSAPVAATENQGKPDALDEFLIGYEKGSLAISCMAFMDAWTIETDRLKKCYIHVASQDGLIPFCVKNTGALVTYASKT